MMRIRALLEFDSAERAGFEPALPFQVNTLSRRARSTTLTPLRKRSANKWRIQSANKFRASLIQFTATEFFFSPKEIFSMSQEV